MAKSKLKVVPMNEANACELVFAAKFCGLDDVRGFTHLFDGDGHKRLESDARLRAKLVAKMSSFGYNRICIDTAHRLSPEDTMIDFDVAQPIRDNAR